MKTFQHGLRIVWWLSAFLCGAANALCLEGKPTLAKEFQSSQLVAVATVIGVTHISEPSDPQGIAATRYDFAKKRLFKGRAKRFSVWIDNTSSRIVFDKGHDYLVFVQQSPGEPFVDACGNSALAKDSGEAIRRLEARGQAWRKS